MILINHSCEPQQLTDAKRALRRTPDPTYCYDSLLPDENGIGPKSATLDQLLRDQGHLCAYCMRRIGHHGSPAHIEHWIPRTKGSGSDSLDYCNMLAVCKGGGKNVRPKDQTCDCRRGNADLNLDPCNRRHIATLSYDGNGIISSSVAELNADINERLNLNSEGSLLPANRRAAYAAANNLIASCYKNCASNSKKGRNHVEKHLQALLRQEDPRDEFIGVVIWRLEQHLRRRH